MKIFSLQIDEQKFVKLRFLAILDNRSVNREINWFITRYIAAFEAEHGPIPPDGDSRTQ